MTTSILQEPVMLRFRGHERTLPLAALALSFRRSPDRIATILEFLIQGPPERRAPPTTEAPRPLPPARGEGVGGGACPERSETLGPETIGSETSGTLERNLQERSDPLRSERERHARETDIDAPASADLALRLAMDLGDRENVAALRRLVDQHPTEVLDRALRLTLAVPAERIRSSRGAIFTGIVRKLAAKTVRDPIP